MTIGGLVVETQHPPYGNMEIPNVLQTLIDNLRSCPQEPRRFRSSLSTSNSRGRRKSDITSKNTCENTCLYKSRGTSRPYPKDPYGSAKAKKTATCTVQALRNVPLTEFVSFWLAQQVVNTYALGRSGGKILTYIQVAVS